MNPWFWLRRPHLIPARVRYWWWERRNPDKPWLTPAAVAFLDRELSAADAGLEFGSGRSTVWFAARLRHLTSVEHHPGWYEAVRARLDRAGRANVDYRLVSLDHPESQPEQPTYAPMPAYVRVAHGLADASLGLVVVDGHYRTHCLLAALPKVKPGGLLLVDDMNLWPGCRPPVPDDWPQVSRSTNGLKWTGVWRRPGAG